MKLLHVVGARPNFVKAAPVYAACRERGFAQLLVHTGQHYDINMSDVFFQQLGLPAPDYNLGVGSGSHAAQTAAVMLGCEPVVLAEQPDWVVVYGDVNSTVAAALVSAKLGIRLAHVEAGLRSFDRTMPEELNRLVTDQLADLLLTPSPDADANLAREGIPAARIRRVGNVMIDSLVRFIPAAESLAMPGCPEHYVLVTLHRPANVDDGPTLCAILAALNRIGALAPVIFPVHPRTRQRIAALPEGTVSANVLLLAPLGYLEFLKLERHAAAVITDSGGMQEETTFLGVPCLTLRPNTERPITIEQGTNRLVTVERLEEETAQILTGRSRPGRVPDLWDGHTAERIAEALASA